MQHKALSQIGGLLWSLVALTIVVEVPVALAWTTPYDPIVLTISDLGATTCTTLDYPGGPVDVCSPLHALMNTVTAVGGVLVGVGALLLRRSITRGAAGVVFAMLMVLSALSWVGAALIPVDEDLALHALVALPAFLAQNLALLLVTRAGDGPCPGWRDAARWVALFGLAATLLTLGAQAWGLPLGLVERVALYPSVLWLAGLGTCLFTGRTRASHR